MKKIPKICIIIIITIAVIVIGTAEFILFKKLFSKNNEQDYLHKRIEVANTQWLTAYYDQNEHNFSFEYPDYWGYNGYVSGEMGNLIYADGILYFEGTYLDTYMTIRFFNNNIGTFDEWNAEHERIWNLDGKLKSEKTYAGQKSYEYNFNNGQEIIIFIPYDKKVYEIRFRADSSNDFTASKKPFKDAQPYLDELKNHIVGSFKFANPATMTAESQGFNNNYPIDSWITYSDDLEGFDVKYSAGWQLENTRTGFVSLKPKDQNTPEITVTVYGIKDYYLFDLRTFFMDNESTLNPYKSNSFPVKLVENGKDMSYFKNFPENNDSTIIYQLGKKIIEVQLLNNPLSNITDLNNIFFSMAKNVEIQKVNWESYENTVYGYRLQNRNSDSMIVDEIFEGNDKNSLNVKILGGGHFTVNVFNNPQHLTVREYFENNNEGINYRYEDMDINGIDAQRIYESNKENCAIEYVGVTYGSRILLSKIEACGNNRSNAVWSSRKIMDSLKITRNEYDILNVKEGDKIGNMEITNINWLSPNKNYADDFTIQFSGQATVSGEFHYYVPDEPFTSKQVCFRVDNFTMTNLPKPDVKSNGSWFCFDNIEYAQKQFGPIGSSGNATIIIDNFYDIFVGTEASPKATLVKVLSKS